VKTAKKGKLPKLPENYFEPVGKGGWPPISTWIIDLVPSSVYPTPPLKTATQVVNLVPPSIDPTPPLKSATKVVDLVPSLVKPTPHSKSEDVSQVYPINID
jgi:hypothetical protein